MKRKLLLASAFSIAFITHIVWSQTAALHRDSSKDLPVVFARTLNTGALAYRKQHNSYPTWAQLVTELKSSKSIRSEIDVNAPEPLPGFDVRWSLSSDGAHYDFLVTEKNHCGANVFSNEVAVIYRATALGCD